MNYPKNRYSGEAPWKNKQWLFEEYIVKDKSTQAIADEYGCKRNTIQCWLLKHGIKKETKKRTLQVKHQYQDKDYLFFQHILMEKPISVIAKENGVSQDTIRYHLKKNGIQPWRMHPPKLISSEDEKIILDLYFNHMMSANQIGALFDITHKHVLDIIRKTGANPRDMSHSQILYNKKEYSPLLDDAKWLEYQHWNKNKSCKEIGEMLGYDAGTIRRKMHKLGIKTKSNAESKIGLMSGEKHPNWQGGLTPLKSLLREYFHVNIVPKIAKRDHYICQKCGVTHTILHIHHMRPFSEIVNEIVEEHPELNVEIPHDRLLLYELVIKDNRFLDESNLVTLCKSCHIKIHKKQS